MQTTCSDKCSKKYYLIKNPDKRSESLKKYNTSEKAKINRNRWVESNPDKDKESKRKYYESHKEEIFENAKKFAREHPDWKRERTAARRAKKKQATPKWVDWDEIEYIYKLAAEKGLEVDHIVPLTSDKVCGLHTGDNLRCIPRELNVHKGNRYWPDMP